LYLDQIPGKGDEAFMSDQNYPEDDRDPTETCEDEDVDDFNEYQDEHEDD
jgi:hypothetical protein